MVQFMFWAAGIAAVIGIAYLVFLYRTFTGGGF